jgi:Family of unknown function (DUF5703)
MEHNCRMQSAAATRSSTDADPEWEYAPLRIPSDVTRVNAAVRLALHAEYGGWELARVRKYGDGSRQVLLRRKRRPAGDLPMPGLIS